MAILAWIAWYEGLCQDTWKSGERFMYLYFGHSSAFREVSPVSCVK